VSNHQEHSINSLANEIKAYLDNHPCSADSPEGIAKWWLSRQRYINSVEQVQMALELLAEEGVLNKSKAADGQTIYRLNQ